MRLELEVRRVDCRQCGKVKRERLDFLADNPFYTKRFAFYVGRRWRTSTIKAVADELDLDWQTVKELDKQYMGAQLARAGRPGPAVIGIDEIAIRKGHTYRIVVSDLLRGRPIWFGGTDRSQASMDEFFKWLGPRKTKGVRLAVMDMWKPFRNSTREQAPQAAILFDKFHVMRHLGEALDKVRKEEYARLSGEKRSYIKGQKYTPALPAGASDPRWSSRLEEAPRRQQAIEYRLSAQGILRPVVVLRARSLGATFLRKLAQRA